MIVEFIDSLFVEEITDGLWRVIAPFSARVTDTDGSVRVVEVPQLFETDFASVPRLPFIFDQFGDRAHKPAVLHDFLYTLGGTEDDRLYADHVFLAAMIADGMDSPCAHEMYDAVRQFGKSHFGPNDPNPPRDPLPASAG